jgi:hypothetical protein
MGPPRLVIKDHDWESPELAAKYLRNAMKNDPNSVFLGSWAKELEKKAEYDRKNVLVWPGWPPKL